MNILVFYLYTVLMVMINAGFHSSENVVMMKPFGGMDDSFVSFGGCFLYRDSKLTYQRLGSIGLNLNSVKSVGSRCSEY